MIPIPNPKTQIINSLQKVVGKIEINLEIPEREEFGDYATNIALVMFGNDQFPISNLQENLKSKILNLKSPHELAETIVSLLKSDKELTKIVDKIQVAGPGFINFHINNDVLLNKLMQIDSANNETDYRSGEMQSVIPAKAGIYTNNDFPQQTDGFVYGQSDLFKGKTILIEHTSPNPQTTIMLGHLRNNFLGMSVANLFDFLGAKVTRDCIVNDRGVHICRSIWGYLVFANKNDGLKKEELKNYKDVAEEKMAGKIKGLNWKELLRKWSDNPADWFTPDELELKPDHANLIWYVLGSKAYKSDESVRKQVGEILQVWEREEKDVWKIWKQILDWSAKGYKETYERIGSIHDHVWHESALYKGGKEFIEKGLKKGVFVKSEGAIVTNLAKYKLPDTVAIKSDGTSTYLVFDINLTAEKQRRYPSDLYIWTIGQEQSLYFQQLFSVCEQLGLGKKDDFFHLSYALINFKGGGKMATREGSVVMADEILDELETKVKKIINDDIKKKKREGVNMDELAHDVALGAVKYALLRYGRGTTAFYDTNESISLNGNSGPYLQYTFARAQSVLHKAQNTHTANSLQSIEDQNADDNPELMAKMKAEDSGPLAMSINEEEKSLLRHLFHFPEIIESAAQNYAPNFICNYLYELAQKFNSFYSKHKILVDDPLVLEFRVRLASATGTVLKSGLNLLGIDSPERM